MTINHFFSTASVVLYDCNQVAMGCSSCISTIYRLNFQCGWCARPNSRCSINEECTSSQSDLITMGIECPDPIITEINPNSGSPIGNNTIVSITGSDLGVNITDFTENSITLDNDLICTLLLDMKYIPGRQVFCKYPIGMTLGKYEVMVTLNRTNGPITVTAPQLFEVVNPTISRVEPSFGPIGGNSSLTITGYNLDIGDTAKVVVFDIEFEIE